MQTFLYDNKNDNKNSINGLNYQPEADYTTALVVEVRHHLCSLIIIMSHIYGKYFGRTVCCLPLLRETFKIPITVSKVFKPVSTSEYFRAKGLFSFVLELSTETIEVELAGLTGS